MFKHIKFKIYDSVLIWFVTPPHEENNQTNNHNEYRDSRYNYQIRQYRKVNVDCCSDCHFLAFSDLRV